MQPQFDPTKQVVVIRRWLQVPNGGHRPTSSKRQHQQRKQAKRHLDSIGPVEEKCVPCTGFVEIRLKAPGMIHVQSLLAECTAPDRQQAWRQWISVALSATWNDLQFRRAVRHCVQELEYVKSLHRRDYQELRALLCLCMALQMAAVTEAPWCNDELDRRIYFLAALTEIGGRECSAGTLIAAQGALERCTAQESVRPDPGAGRRIAMLKLTILMCWRLQIEKTLWSWGQAAAEVDDCLRDVTVVQAFARLFDASALHPRFELIEDDVGVGVRVVGFAPIHPRHAPDVAEVVDAMRAQHWEALASSLEAGIVEAGTVETVSVADVEAIQTSLNDGNAPYELRFKRESARWRLRASRTGRVFEWATHGSAYMDLVQVVLSLPDMFVEDVVESAFRVLVTYFENDQAVDSARLLALILSAVGRVDGSVEELLWPRFQELACQTDLVHMALKSFGPAVFAGCIELAAHKAYASFKEIADSLLESVRHANIFIRLCLSERGRRALDDCLHRIVQDPSLLQRPAMVTLLATLVCTECDRRLPSRCLLEHPVLRIGMATPDAPAAPAMLECLLLLRSDERAKHAPFLLKSASGLGKSFLTVRHFLSGRGSERVGNEDYQALLNELSGLAGVQARLHLAMVAAVAADELDRTSCVLFSGRALTSLLDLQLQLVEALLQVRTIPADEKNAGETVQFMVYVMQLTLRLCRGRHCIDMLPREFGHLHARRAGPDRSRKGVAWQFGMAALLAFFYLREAKSTTPLTLEMVPSGCVAERLARTMCAALWCDVGHGWACRQQLERAMRQGARAPQRTDRTDMGLLPPDWFDLAHYALFKASLTMPG